MALSPEDRKIRRKEMRIGREAAEMATRYLHLNINRSFDVKNKGGIFSGKPIKPMLEASKVRAKMGQYFLLGLDASSNKYAFIHHYGFKGKRAGSLVYYDAPKWRIDGSYREPHMLDVKSRSIFKNLYTASGARDHIVYGLIETRSESFIEKFSELIDKFKK